MTTAYLNRIATAVPEHDVHECFISYARSLLGDNRRQLLFQRMVDRAAISHRWSFLEPAASAGSDAIDAGGFYRRGRFATTAERMARYGQDAPVLAARAVDRLGLGRGARDITHLITVSCTGLFAPGIEFDLIRRFGIPPQVERTHVGFMGCQAAINALKLARHIVRSEPAAKVLIASVELCTLHLQETDEIETLLSFLIFGDGCAAALVSAAPEGLALERFHAFVADETADLITWNVGDRGFDMFLSGRVPRAIGGALGSRTGDILNGTPFDEVRYWAVHPGGRTVLDAVADSLGLKGDALGASRRVLDDFGNMSSATVLFVLQDVMARAARDERGCAMSFGPGLSAETMTFRVA